jgi:serine/threonine-protein kinase
MAPEQATGAPPDPRQDLYAVGMVAAELLTGGGPGDPTPADPLGELIGALTDPHPARRPATASLALEHLRALGVPHDAPWQADPDAPDVVDVYGDPPRPGLTVGGRVPAYAWAVPAVFAGAGLTGGLASWLVVR